MNVLSCTFFGHRDCSEEIIPKLHAVIEKLITENGCNVFYVGNHGNFDRYVSRVLEELRVSI